MMTNRSSHIPMLMTMESSQSATTLARIFDDHSSWGIRTFVRMRPQ